MKGRGGDLKSCAPIFPRQRGRARLALVGSGVLLWWLEEITCCRHPRQAYLILSENSSYACCVKCLAIHREGRVHHFSGDQNSIKGKVTTVSEGC